MSYSLFVYEIGRKKYSVVAKIRLISEYYSGYEWESRIHENLADFIVNGIPGKGIAEFAYRYTKLFILIPIC